MLEDGRLHLSGIAKLVPVLTEANCDELLARAAHKSKRKIEELVAEVAPKPDVASRMRKLPAKREPSTPAPVVLRPDRVARLATEGSSTEELPCACSPYSSTRRSAVGVSSPGLRSRAVRCPRRSR